MLQKPVLSGVWEIAGLEFGGGWRGLGYAM